jgi:predicted MFS family arabinose efflux permease
MSPAVSETNGQTAPSAPRPLSAMLVVLMAAATGIAVANIYYAQPLLDTLSRAFDVPVHTAGLIVTVTQIGYAAGLMFVVPLGDLLERRRLVAAVSVATSFALILAALAPGIYWFAAASLAIGVTAVVAQILVPYAAHLAPDHLRGRVVGRVMSGLLLGILLARTVSGVLSDAFGWRSVFWLAAAVMLVQAAILARILPEDRASVKVSYPALLRSVLHLMRDEALLRRRIVYGALMFATFSALWTALPFLLARPPYGYGDGVIGGFGLFGVAGALCASLAGHLHDKGWTHHATGLFLISVLAAFVIMGAAGQSIVAIIVGVILLDIGVQGTQILNQSTIYQLRPEARSRMTTAYMTCYFAGGAAGSAGAAFAFGVGGWSGVALLGVTLPTLALLYWVTDRPVPMAAPGEGGASLHGD